MDGNASITPEQALELNAKLSDKLWPALKGQMTKEKAQRFIENPEKVLKALRMGFSTDSKVDLSADPHLPHNRWEVIEHKGAGTVTVERRKNSLYVGDKKVSLIRPQGAEEGVDGHAILDLLEKETVLNVNVLDYLLDNPEMIPEAWPYEHIFFWGTIYRDLDGFPCVRFLNNQPSDSFYAWRSLKSKWERFDWVAVLD